MLRYIVSITAFLSSCAVSGQPCDTLIFSNTADEYCQRERSVCRTFFGKPPIVAEMWADKVGNYVYFNMLLKDSASGLPLNKSYGNNQLAFHFYGGKSISYSYVDTTMKSVISIPLNKRPDDSVKVVLRIDDSSVALKDYQPFLDAVYLDTLIYVSFSKVNREKDIGKVRFTEFLYLNLKKPEAIRLRESVYCIFKAVQ